MEPSLSDGGRLVSVVLVTWNSAPLLRSSLGALRAQTYEPIEILVVDNASTDGSAAMAEEIVPSATVIRNQENRGFSAAVNQAIKLAKGDFVLFCNPDARLAPDYVTQLVEALETTGKRFGSATGTLMRGSNAEIAPTDVVDTKGIRMTRTGRHFDIGQGMSDTSEARGLRPLAHSSCHEVFGVSGAAALHRKVFLDDVALEGEVLDEDFFAFREDADLGWRGQLLGWSALHVPAAVGWHVRTVTPARRRALSPIVNMHSVKNRFLLRLKNEGLYLAIRNAPFELFRDLVTIVATLTIERSSLPALRWLWKNRRRVWQKRRMIQKRRRVTDRELAGWFR